MVEITTKSTKAEIMEAYKELKAKLDEQDKLVDDPVKDAIAENKKTVMTNADDIAEQSILNPAIIAQYNDLKEAITIKRAELRSLYDLEAETNSFVAMVNAHKQKEIELKEKYDTKAKELDTSLNEKAAALRKDIEMLEAEKKDALISIQKESDALKAELKKQREREEEEYEYDLNRDRKEADDLWTDKINKREKELAERIAAVRADEDELAEKTSYIEELERKVADIPTLVQKATEEGVEKGKADANKSNAFEVRYLKQENEYKVRDLTNQIEKLTNDVNSLASEKGSLQNKLDDAYAQMRELAAETVKSSGGVKILNGQSQQVGK